MEKQIAEGNIGSVGKYDVEFKDGEVVAEISAEAGVAKFSAKLTLDGKSVAIAGLEYLKAKIPGQIDDAIINALEEKIKTL